MNIFRPRFSHSESKLKLQRSFVRSGKDRIERNEKKGLSARVSLGHDDEHVNY